MGNGERSRFDPLGGQLFGHGQDGFTLARDDNAVGAIDRGNVNLTAMGCNCRQHARLESCAGRIRQQRDHCAILGQRAHQPPAGRD